jgi:hypothetical protein
MVIAESRSCTPRSLDLQISGCTKSRNYRKQVRTVPLWICTKCRLPTRSPIDLQWSLPELSGVSSPKGDMRIHGTPSAPPPLTSHPLTERDMPIRANGIVKSENAIRLGALEH